MSKKYTWMGVPLNDFTREKIITICISLMERIVELERDILNKKL